MVGYILGRYLVQKGKISDEKLSEILNNMKKARVKLGVIAVSEGIMTISQTEEINRLQAVMDKRFGDLAIENNYLTLKQLDTLVQKQGSQAMIFLQTLLDRGIFTMEEADCFFEEFQEYYGLSSDQIEDIKVGNLEKIIPLFMPNISHELQQLAGIAVRTIMRCTDSDIAIEKAEICHEINGKNGSFQSIQKEDGTSITIGLIEDAGGFLNAASLFAGEEFEEVNLDALDSCGELLNCINGIYATMKSKNGEEFELLPPEMYEEDISIKSTELICNLPIILKGKKMRLVVWNS